MLTVAIIAESMQWQVFMAKLKPLPSLYFVAGEVNHLSTVSRIFIQNFESGNEDICYKIQNDCFPRQ